ncbi:MULTISPECIES: hypothetical protein [unclassified Roseovarius]|uniref:hypothetical protein n=1 Tax=unclassified Roseovarius TaxID=2614913 RepID=UPI0027401CAA|nr:MULTISPECIES: hypothetical protein [unclassified Roseovarius]
MKNATLLTAALAAFACAGPSIAASGDETVQIVRHDTVMPPDGYSAQWWTHPKGCEYSRAGRPGEIVWFLIVNTVKPGCPTHIVQRGFSDAY